MGRGVCAEDGKGQPGLGSYLLVVLFQVGHLLAQGLILNLQVCPAQGDFIQDSAQPVDVRLHALVKSQLVLIPEKMSKIFPVSYPVGHFPREQCQNSRMQRWPVWLSGRSSEFRVSSA